MAFRLSTNLRAAGIFAVLAALAFSPSAQAQYALSDSSEWEHLGAHRQRIFAFGFSGSPEALVVWGGAGGIYRLLDTPGGSWDELAFSPFGGPVFMVGSAPDTVFVGNHLYRSTDNGQSFERLTSLANGEGERVDSQGGFSRFPPDSPYPYRLVAGDYPSVFYSDDSGDTWTRPESSPTHKSVAIHAFASGRALSVGWYGAAVSDDGARTLRHVPALYDLDRVSFDLRSLQVFPGVVTGQPGDSREGRVLVTGDQLGRGMLIWASDDEGDSWREVRSLANFCSEGFLMSLVGPDVGGEVGWAVGVDCDDRVYATRDGGETWLPIGKVPIEPVGLSRTYAAAVGPDGRLYAGTSRNGPQKSWSWRTREPVADLVRFAVAGQEAPAARATLGVAVFPNPTGGSVTVAVQLAAPEHVEITVLDVRGRVVLEVHQGAAQDGQRFAVETAGLALGAYVVRVTSASGAATAGLTVAR